MVFRVNPIAYGHQACNGDIMITSKNKGNLKPGWEDEHIRFMIPANRGPHALHRYFHVNYYPEHVERLLSAADD